MNSSSSSTSSGAGAQGLEDILAACLSAMEHGETFDRLEVMTRHPEWADELREFFENWDEMESLSSRWNATHSLTPPASAPLSLSGTFGDYELFEEIGRGGMGVIYKARQLSLDRIVALKMISHPHHDLNRFRLEAELAASLDHPHIVSIYAIGEIDGHPYFSMPFLEGPNLSQRIAEGPISPQQAAEWIVQIAEAVHYAHQRGILHRDLKPANVLLDSRSQVHVTDFGLAKQFTETTCEAGQITATGAILGTPSYMSPEQADGSGSRVTTATDIYGLGAILYTLLTGRPPFESASSIELLRQVVQESPARPRTIRSEIPRDLETICLTCLEKDPTARYTSAQALADDLFRFLRHQPIEARPVGPIERAWRWCRRNPWMAALSSIVVLSLALTAMISTTMARREYRARLEAESGRQREFELRRAMNRSMLAETAARRQAVATLVESFVSNGLAAHDADDPSLALLWFLEAFKRAESGSTQQQLIGRRILSWSQRAPQLVNAWKVPDVQGSELAFDSSGRWLLGRFQEAAVVWSLSQEDPWPVPHVQPVVTAVWHPTEAWLLSVEEGGSLRAWSPTERDEKFSFLLSETAEQAVFSADGRALAAVVGTEVAVWRESGEWKSLSAPMVVSHPGEVLHAEWDPRGERLLTACADGKARVWNWQDGQWILVTESIPCLIRRREDGPLLVPPRFLREHYVAVGQSVFWKNRPEYLRIDIYDLRSGKQVAGRLVGESRHFLCDPAGDRFLNLGHHYGRMTDFPTRSHSDRLLYRGEVTAAQFSPDGHWVATGSTDRMVRIWRTQANPYAEALVNGARTTMSVLPHLQAVKTLAWSKTGRLATFSAEGIVRVWELPLDPHILPNSTPVLVETPIASGQSSNLVAPIAEQDADKSKRPRISADGTRCIAIGRDGVGRVTWVATGVSLPVQLTHEGPVLDALFTPDDRWIITLGADELVKVWDADSGQLMSRPVLTPTRVTDLSLSAEGTSLELMTAAGEPQFLPLHELCGEDGASLGDSLPWQDLQRRAELASGRRIESDRVQVLTSHEWMELWAAEHAAQ